jgi:hypothetical protein
MSKSNIVLYFAVDKDGAEMLFASEPRRNATLEFWTCGAMEDGIELPTGSIKKWTGQETSFEEGFIIYVGENYDPSPDTQPAPI